MTIASSPTAFPTGYRAAGVLLHVTSLPGPFGIGDMGPAAHEWIDRLADAGQSWWQVLPLGPIGRGNSPYEPVSSFAGNPLLVSPERLVADGLLSAADLPERPLPADFVDYETVIPLKAALVER